VRSSDRVIVFYDGAMVQGHVWEGANWVEALETLV
jgi:hypothetical protein